MPRFVPSRVDPRRMIARVTLETLRAVLRGSGSRRLDAPPGGEQTVEVRLGDHPMLARIGGIARIDPGPGGAIAIARIGGSCFAAFTLGADGLLELPVEVDADAAVLRILRPTLTAETAAPPRAS